jgi:hypothetical protein|tara:strand:- start:38 stop:562 length:525 start_codon:yes stop_codon:yes gene_type:complete
MAIDKVTSASITTDAVGPTQLNEASNYAFTGTVTGTPANTPNMYAKLSGDQTISNNTTTTIAFASEIYDTANAYNNSTYLFTAPSAGKYVCHIHLRYNDAQSNRNAITLYINSDSANQYSFEQSPGNVFSTSGGMGILNLSANDTVQWKYYQSSGGNIVVRSADSYMGIFKLSE